jgi:monovalent cation/hydrogen antiporter
VVLLAALVAGIVVLTPLADRVRVPQPIVLLLYGLLLALVPAVPEPALRADLVLPVVLPPLLFAATQRTTIGQFRDAARPILLLAVGLTAATAAVAAVVAHLMGLPWAAAGVLGAIVSPPDPVAATAVARRLRLPERMVTVLEGEGMFNDATALVMYKAALAVAVTGQFRPGEAAVGLVLAIVVGTGLGVILGWLTTRALAALHDASPETTVTIAAPFIAYLGAEHLRGSGVLAVLSLGLYLRSYGHPAITARGWLVGRSVWDYADFVITGLVFVMVGFELTTVLRHASADGSTDASTLRLGAAVLAAVVLLRPLWLFPVVALAASWARRREASLPYGWRETALVSWAGMRGVVTVATALALPSTADGGTRLLWRQPVVLVGLGCVMATLVVQGLTLTPLVRALGVGSEADEATEVRELRLRAMREAVQALRSEADASSDPASRVAITYYEGRIRAQEIVRRTLEQSGDGAHGSDPELEERLERAWRRGNDVERDVVLTARAEGTVTPAAADEVLHDIEVRAARPGT